VKAGPPPAFVLSRVFVADGAGVAACVRWQPCRHGGRDDCSVTRMEQSVEGGGALLRLVLCEHLIELIADSCSHTRSGCGVLLPRMNGTWAHCRVDCAGRKGGNTAPCRIPLQTPTVRIVNVELNPLIRGRRARQAHPQGRLLAQRATLAVSGLPAHVALRRTDARGQRDSRPLGWFRRLGGGWRRLPGETPAHSRCR
jgi:hypothetical protein